MTGKGKLILASSIANTFEWYDYALYGHFAALIARKFFPDTDPKVSILQAFLVFAVGYLMRPIGGVVFGIIGDKWGRKTALSISVICMSLPTAIIGILPTYQDIGITATILMIFVRILQGLSMGGALTGSISFIIEHTNSKKRGFSGSLPMAGICMGLLLGASVSFIIQLFLSPEQFDSWGWRIPFLLGIFIFFVGNYIRKFTNETPLFNQLKKEGKLTSAPLKEVFSKYWFDMLMSIFINATGSVIFYLQAIYLMTYLKKDKVFSGDKIDILNNVCYVVIAFSSLIAGRMSDIIGRRKIFVIINIVILIFFASGAMYGIESSNFSLIIICQLILALIAGAYIGPEPALQAEFYPTNIRNTALSISYNVATSIFGGTTPYILELIIQRTGTITSVNYYIYCCTILSLVGLYFYKDRAKI